RGERVRPAMRTKLGISGWVSAAVLTLVALAALFPHLLAPGDPAGVDPAAAFTPPSADALLGTDTSGRDVFTRVVHGAGESVGIALAATGIGMILALVLGFGSLAGRWLDAALNRVIEVLFSLPTLVLALLLVAVMGAGARASVIAVGLATAPGYARILRSRVRSVAGSGFIQAARLEGAGPGASLGRHLAPNSLWPLVAVATLGIGQAIVWVAALSFLGLGALPPSPEWGAMLNAGRLHISGAWWLTVFPGLAITLTAAVLTVLGRRLRRVGS